jgi:hypothetical protein
MESYLIFLSHISNNQNIFDIDKNKLYILQIIA